MSRSRETRIEVPSHLFILFAVKRSILFYARVLDNRVHKGYISLRVAVEGEEDLREVEAMTLGVLAGETRHQNVKFFAREMLGEGFLV